MAYLYSSLPTSVNTDILQTSNEQQSYDSLPEKEQSGKVGLKPSKSVKRSANSQQLHTDTKRIKTESFTTSLFSKTMESASSQYDVYQIKPKRNLTPYIHTLNNELYDDTSIYASPTKSESNDDASIYASPTEPETYDDTSIYASPINSICSTPKSTPLESVSPVFDKCDELPPLPPLKTIHEVQPRYTQVKQKRNPLALLDKSILHQNSNKKT